MLHEYAIDPSLFGTLQEFLLWSERFGISRARIISAYPRHWKKLANEAIQESDEIKRQSLKNKIRRIDENKKLLRLPRGEYDGKLSWLDNACSEHQKASFHAIVARENSKAYPDVLIGDDVDDETKEFDVQHGRLIPRNAKAMADALSLLLRVSKRVIFIDPYFHPAELRFRKPLEAFLAEAKQGKPLTEVQYHLSHEYRDSPPSPDFKRACRSYLPQIIPDGVKLTLYRWKNLPNQDDMHPRYILTDIAGVRFEHGLDEGTTGQTIDIEIIANDIYEQRLRDYQEKDGTFKLHDTVEISSDR